MIAVSTVEGRIVGLTTEQEAGSSMNIIDIIDIRSILAELRLPYGHFIVGGSAALIAAGYDLKRPIGDLDIFVRPWVYADIRRRSMASLPFEWEELRPRPDDPPYLEKHVQGLPVNIFDRWKTRQFRMDPQVEINLMEWHSGIPTPQIETIIAHKQYVVDHQDNYPPEKVPKHIHDLEMIRSRWGGPER
jgi:hypothetical protein